MSLNKRYFLFSITISLAVHVSFLFFVGRYYQSSINPVERAQVSVMKITISDISESVKIPVQEKLVQEEKKKVFKELKKEINEQVQKEENVILKTDDSIKKTPLENVEAITNIQKSEKINILEDNEIEWFSVNEIKEHLSLTEKRLSRLNKQKKEMSKGTFSELKSTSEITGKAEKTHRSLLIPIIPPDFNINKPPVYPRVARLRGMEGTVLLRLKIDSKGSVIRVLIEKSSGYPILDSAALEAAGDWTFYPARKADEEIWSEVLVPVTFKLD